MNKVLKVDDKVLMSRASEEDIVFSQFLSFLANDIKNNPAHVHSIKLELLDRARSLISDVEVDLDVPLDEKDE